MSHTVSLNKVDHLNSEPWGRSVHRSDNLRENIRDWLERLEKRHGVSRRQLAVRAGISPTTIYRAMETDGQFVMSTSKLAQVAQAFGSEMPSGLTMEPGQPPQGFGEDTVAPYEGEPPDNLPAIGNHQELMTVAGLALDLAGYRPGDVVVVDMSVEPEPGDVVCAMVYSFERGSVEKQLRVYYPPYLVTRSSDARVDGRPLYVDGERVALCGTVVRMIRERVARPTLTLA